MKNTALVTMMLLGTTLVSAQTLRELKDNVAYKLDRVNNNRSVIMNMDRRELIQIEASLDDILTVSRQGRIGDGRGRRGDGRRGNRPGRRFGRAEALQALDGIENSPADVNSVFSIIESKVQSNLINWEEGVTAYSEILILAGGSGKTSTAKTVFENFVRDINLAGITPDSGLVELRNLAREENTLDDASESFRIAIDQASRIHMNPTKALQAMTILTNTLGSGETSSIRTTFISLAQNKVSDIILTTQDFLEINRLENTVVDALGNYLLVTAAVQRGAHYNRAFNTMKSLIERLGASETGTIRQQFNMLYN